MGTRCLDCDSGLIDGLKDSASSARGSMASSRCRAEGLAAPDVSLLSQPHQIADEAAETGPLSRSPSDVSEMQVPGPWLGVESEGAAGLVAARAGPDGYERHAFGPGDRSAGGFGIETDERARAGGNLLVVDPVDAGASDDDVHLFLARVGLIVFAPDDVRPELVPVDPERTDAELAADEANSVARPSRGDVVDVDDRMAHRYIV